MEWRQNGTWQHERFIDEPSATVFEKTVEDHGNVWLPGWVKRPGSSRMRSGGGLAAACSGIYAPGHD